MTVLHPERNQLMNNKTASVLNRNNRLHTEAVADILNRIEQYRFIPKHFLTVDFHRVYKSADQLVEHVGHIDRVIKTFIHRNKWHTDTPGRIYFIEPHAVRGYHLHIVMEALPENAIEHHTANSFLVSSKSGIVEMMKEDWAMKMLAAYLLKHVKSMSQGRWGFNNTPIYDIDGLIRYLNKSFYDPRVPGCDHIEIMHSSIYVPKWTNNRLNTIQEENNGRETLHIQRIA
jgi:hypothetical protein